MCGEQLLAKPNSTKCGMCHFLRIYKKNIISMFVHLQGIRVTCPDRRDLFRTTAIQRMTSPAGPSLLLHVTPLNFRPETGERSSPLGPCCSALPDHCVSWSQFFSVLSPSFPKTVKHPVSFTKFGLKLSLMFPFQDVSSKNMSLSKGTGSETDIHFA